MALADTLLTDLKSAMKSGDTIARDTLRMIRSEITKKEIALGKTLSDEEEMSVLLSAVKSRNESLLQYDEAGRSDLADKERAEIAVIEKYLPKQLSETEARDAIKAIISDLGVSDKRDMGRVMGEVMKRHRGTIDGKLASRLAAQLLS